MTDEKEYRVEFKAALAYLLGIIDAIKLEEIESFRASKQYQIIHDVLFSGYSYAARPGVGEEERDLLLSRFNNPNG